MRFFNPPPSVFRGMKRLSRSLFVSSIPLRDRPWFFYVAASGFWAVLMLIEAGQYLFSGNSWSGWSTQNAIVYSLWLGVSFVLIRLTKQVPMARTAWVKRIMGYMVLGWFFTLLVDTGERLAHEQFVHSPDRRDSVSETLYMQTTEDLLAFRAVEWIIYLTLLGSGVGLAYATRSRQSAINRQVQRQTQAVELQRQLTEARLQALRMQLNPHFLFNTLHAITAFVERDPDAVYRMVARLSEILRHALERSDQQEVPLSEELDFLDKYLEIIQIRFGDRVLITKEIDLDALEALVPDLILQPLVENAVEHGVSRITEEGEIVIRAERWQERLHLSIQDNGPGLPLDADARGSGVGVQNTRERLQQLYGSAASLSFHDAPGGGCIVRLAFPYHTAIETYTAAALP